MKKFAKCVAKAQANFEKNQADHATRRRMWGPETPAMTCPIKANGTISQYFGVLLAADTRRGILCREVRPVNQQKLRWCGLVETKRVNGEARYFTTPFGKEYIAAAHGFI